jgi:SAM-dependent methyltransferase
MQHNEQSQPLGLANVADKNSTSNREKTSGILAPSTAAELFDIVWKENKYKGFSHKTVGESKTPFLDTFLEQLPLGGACVVELGAGSCDHAVRMAKEEGIIKQVTAVEYSQTAVTAACERLANFDAGVRSRLTIECNDLFTFMNKLEPNTIQGIYANSVLHFFTPKEREDLYQQAYKVLTTSGIIAVSFKAIGDALYKRGELVEETPAGVIIRDATDHICRLFVSPTGVDVLGAELRSAGFRVESVLRWSVPDYNIDGDDGQFVGFIGIR